MDLGLEFYLLAVALVVEVDLVDVYFVEVVLWFVAMFERRR